MLKDKTSSAIVAVSDLARARAFYETALGLETDGGTEDGVLSFKTGDTSLTVYASDNFRPGTGNAVAWSGGDDVEAIAADLRDKGVVLEEYSDMGMSMEDGIHKDGDFAAIWFKDPDGNILHVNSM